MRKTINTLITQWKKNMKVANMPTWLRAINDRSNVSTNEEPRPGLQAGLPGRPLRLSLPVLHLSRHVAHSAPYRQNQQDLWFAAFCVFFGLFSADFLQAANWKTGLEKKLIFAAAVCTLHVANTSDKIGGGCKAMRQQTLLPC